MNRLYLLYCIMIFSFFSQTLGQNEYDITIKNCKLINEQTYEFDIYINSRNQSFELTSYQSVITFNYLSLNDNENSLAFNYIEGSSDLSNFPSTGISINSTNSPIYYLTFASSVGSDIIDNQEIRIGKFQLKGSKNFLSSLILNWNFEGKISTIFTGPLFENITSNSSHYIEEGNNIKINIVNVEASNTTDVNTAPSKVMDGLGFNDGDLNSRWAAQPLPQWITFDLGAEKSINTSKISFYKFEQDRIYTYSISVSNNLSDWNYLVTEASSLSEEWTTNSFDQVKARYIKVELLSATNNPDNWAGIWEAEFYSSSPTTNTNEPIIIPENSELLQNYPNPFNPTTTINFEINKNGYTKLSVYNIVGEFIKDLISEELTAGKYSIKFNASYLPSGIYIYALKSSEFNQVRKMILLK